MENYVRFAVYYAPPKGAFADHAAEWLGWNPDTGTEPAQNPTFADLRDLTQAPRKYGFHGTIKPPFRLAEGQGPDNLLAALRLLASRLNPVWLDGLHLERIGRWLALTPTGDLGPLSDLADEIVVGLDVFRAPLSEADRARRNPEKLTQRQRELLDRWGYPYVCEEFKFHLTLTDRVPDDRIAAVEAMAQQHFAGVLPVPFIISDLCLFGEAEDGRFILLHRVPLSG